MHWAWQHDTHARRDCVEAMVLVRQMRRAEKDAHCTLREAKVIQRHERYVEVEYRCYPTRLARQWRRAGAPEHQWVVGENDHIWANCVDCLRPERDIGWSVRAEFPGTLPEFVAQDRKSTRLNSSHDQISYAV